MFARVIISLIRLYQRWLRPALPVCCRFHPTCSQFAVEALQKYGCIRGGGKALLRVLRCHPYSRAPIEDPLR